MSNPDSANGALTGQTASALTLPNAPGPSSGTTSNHQTTSKTQDTQSLTNLTETFEELRSLITCKICFRMLYEPFTNSCGHTFCYSCLSQWFNNSARKKSCPDCRATVRHAPAPAYIVRDMTQKFINQPGLLPDGETAEQHEHWRREEAEVVELDRTNPDPIMGGLFKGCFGDGGQPHGRPAMRDVEDGVDRCPNCAWELEGDTVCTHCGYEIDASHSEEDYSSDDLSGPSVSHSNEDEEDTEEEDADIDIEDQDVEDGFANWGYTNDELGDGREIPDFSDEDGSDASMSDAFDAGSMSGVSRNAMTYLQALAQDIRVSEGTMSMADPHGPRVLLRRRAPTHEDSEEDEGDVEEDDDEEDDSEDDSEMNDFIDDEQEDRESNRSRSTPRQTSTPPIPRRGRPQVIDSEDEDRPQVIDSEDEDDESDASSTEQRSLEAIVNNGSDVETESESEDSDSDDEGGGVSNGVRRR